MSKSVEFLIIDPQNDFCHVDGSLFVPGADSDTVKLAKMLENHMKVINDIHVSLDTHRFVDIAHPIFWKNSDGKHPDPFTMITVQDVDNGTWRPVSPQMRNRVLDYVKALETGGRYALCIWPPHCLIGTWGHNVVKSIQEQLLAWEKNFAWVDYVTKGSNPWTEHYSILQADVPDPEDPDTMLNQKLIKMLQEADLIALSGQALSHCVANTVRDIADNFGEDNIKKLVLIEDTSSSVSGFENLGEDFVKEMIGRGMQIARSTDFLV